MSELPRARLSGTHVVDFPPLRTTFLALPDGLTVLYGRNGAGKTRLLAAIEGLFGAQPVDGDVELYYTWPAPHADAEPKDVARWLEIRGNPWNQTPAGFGDAVGNTLILSEDGAAMERQA